MRTWPTNVMSSMYGCVVSWAIGLGDLPRKCRDVHKSSNSVMHVSNIIIVMDGECVPRATRVLDIVCADDVGPHRPSTANLRSSMRSKKEILNRKHLLFAINKRFSY